MYFTRTFSSRGSSGEAMRNYKLATPFLGSHVIIIWPISLHLQIHFFICVYSRADLMNSFLHTFQNLIRPSSRNPENCATISSEVWVLGRQYPEKNDAFLSDVFAKSFFSYRYDFLPITNLHNDGDGTRVSSDAGWGCMHRSGQMLIAQALTYSALGRGTFLQNLNQKCVILNR